MIATQTPGPDAGKPPAPDDSDTPPETFPEAKPGRQPPGGTQPGGAEPGKAEPGSEEAGRD